MTSVAWNRHRNQSTDAQKGQVSHPRFRSALTKLVPSREEHVCQNRSSAHIAQPSAKWLDETLVLALSYLNSSRCMVVFEFRVCQRQPTFPWQIATFRRRGSEEERKPTSPWQHHTRKIISRVLSDKEFLLSVLGCLLESHMRHE